ncbi:PfkB domain-containing protein [Raphidiopsis curvata NIES-932]|nr:PfkB domain-containing protein [Raphidiopsis curvata NIES-932]
MKKSALFIGLITLDLIYLAESPPKNNQKLVAMDYTVAAGGPATNASVTFSYLDNNSTVLGVLGSHHLTKLISTDLANYEVRVIDLDPRKNTPPPVSSIIVTQQTGERAVISLNAVKSPGDINSIPSNILEGIDLILIDGHQMVASKTLIMKAKNQNIPIVMDGGSWKEGLEEILPYIDYAICSANFQPPPCQTRQDIFTYLLGFNIPHIAITQGEKPIEYYSIGQRGSIYVPQIKTVDTLGAGDIFHGAFCHYILQSSFTMALALASKIAAKSCELFGTRRWMEEQKP